MEKLPSIHLTSKEHIDPWEQSMSRNERKLVLDPYRWCRRSGEGRSSGQLDHTIWLRDEACGDPLLETLPSEFAAEFRVVPFNVASGGDHEVFNYSTLTTLLVLLVGETVTGSSEFAYIFNMLVAILEDGRAISDAPSGAREFLIQQSRM